MNLSQVQGDSLEDLGGAPQTEIIPRLQAEESRLVRIIEAIQAVQQTKGWSTLKIEVFDNLVNVLEKDLRTEARKTDTDTNKLNRISGELAWAEKFSDLGKLESTYRFQLQNVRKQLHGKSEELA
jgi:hypothetical protein